MTKKRLTRDAKWGFQYFPYYQMRIEHKGVQGWVALNELRDGEYLYWNFEQAGDIPVAGKGMSWLTFIPDGKKRSITAMFTKDENVSAWYVDVIESVTKDEDGILLFVDQYLDVMLTTAGDIVVDDRDELDAAYQSGELSKEQYEAALQEGEQIIEDMCGDIHETERQYRDMLRYVRAQVEQHPLTIFLDIDGVLDIFNPDVEEQYFLQDAVQNLSELVQRMNAKVVVISSHRQGGKSWDSLQGILKKNHIMEVDITPWGDEYHNRTEEIEAYLKQHSNIERYVILDDCFQDEYNTNREMKERLVFVDALKGLQKKDVIEACGILNKENREHERRGDKLVF